MGLFRFGIALDLALKARKSGSMPISLCQGRVVAKRVLGHGFVLRSIGTLLGSVGFMPCPRA